MTIAKIDTQLLLLETILRNNGISQKVIQSVKTRALRSARRQTGEFPSNRHSRWKLKRRDPQYGTEKQSKLVCIKLLLDLLQFENAPTLQPADQEIVEKMAGRKVISGTYRDPLTLEGFDFNDFVKVTDNPSHGYSPYHMGHLNPRIQPKHMDSNVAWMSKESNVLQGDLTIDEARKKILAIADRIKQCN